MKMQFNIFSCLLFLSLTALSCRKEKDTKPYLPSTGLPPPSGYVVDNKEYFWGVFWHKTTRGYETDLDTSRLTDSTISKGVNVYVAMWTEMTTFQQIPSIFYDFVRSDSIHLSYTVVPGKLQVLAETPLGVDYQSDVLVEYK